MVGSSSKKLWGTWNTCRFLENCWWQTWLPPIQHEQSSSQHYEFGQKTAILKCKFVIGTWMNTLLWNGKKKGWRCSLNHISKVYRYQHQKTKLKNKISSLCKWFLSSKKLKSISHGVKIAKVLYFSYNPMEPFISGVRPSNTQKSSNFHCLNDSLSRIEHKVSSNS